MSDLRERLIAEISEAMVDYAMACEGLPFRERTACRVERSSQAADAILPLIGSAVEEMRERAAGAVGTLIETLQEGLMTDAGLSDDDRRAMNHQVGALDHAMDEIRSLPMAGVPADAPQPKD